MKLILFLGLIFSASTFAESAITLSPGSSATVRAGESTQVFCAASAPIKCVCAKQASGKFCARYYNFEDSDFYCAGPGATTALFNSVEDCQLALPSIAVCY